MHMYISSMQLHFQVYSTYICTFGREGSHSLFEWDFATIMCAAHTIIITIESQNKKGDQHKSSLFYFYSCRHCPHLHCCTNHDRTTANKVIRTGMKVSEKKQSCTEDRKGKEAYY